MSRVLAHPEHGVREDRYSAPGPKLVVVVVAAAPGPVSALIAAAGLPSTMRSLGHSVINALTRAESAGVAS